MEIGRVAEIDNSKINNIEKAQKVSNVDEKNEVILDNVKFGYNKNSKDFFVKVTRGDAEYKYPTEDMMKVKAYILQELEQNNKA
ncbi:MAG: flagellin [Arcobacter sp.]|uniref:flagellin n=1 Tax=Arcobacter sp. TaxID=1872629 RepID=UPI003CFF787D